MTHFGAGDNPGRDHIGDAFYGAMVERGPRAAIEGLMAEYQERYLTDVLGGASQVWDGAQALLTDAPCSSIDFDTEQRAVKLGWQFRGDTLGGAFHLGFATSVRLIAPLWEGTSAREIRQAVDVAQAADNNGLVRVPSGSPILGIRPKENKRSFRAPEHLVGKHAVVRELTAASVLNADRILATTTFSELGSPAGGHEIQADASQPRPPRGLFSYISPSLIAMWIDQGPEAAEAIAREGLDETFERARSKFEKDKLPRYKRLEEILSYVSLSTVVIEPDA